MHYYQFNIGDYHSHTAHLDPLEDIAYRRMIDWCYLHEKPLPADIDEIAREIRMREHCTCIAYVLQKYFTLTETGYLNNRIVKEIKEYKSISSKRKKAANKRWANKHAGLSGDASALQVQSKSNAKQEPRTKKQETRTNKDNKPSSTEVDNRPFEIFTYWKEVMGKNNSAKPTAKRISCIKARLKEGYSIERIKLAIDGCKGSAHHRGDNDQGKIYDDLTLICRSGDKVEIFEEYLTRVPAKESNQMTAFEQLTDTSWADDLMGYQSDKGIIEHE